MQLLSLKKSEFRGQLYGTVPNAVSSGQTGTTTWTLEKSGYRLYFWFFIIYSKEK